MLQLITQLLLKFKYQIAIFIGGLVVALSFGWWAWNPAPKKPEVYAPPVQQVDGSVILEKKPQPDAKPEQKLPKGSTLIRKASITVQAKVPTATTLTTMTVEPVAHQAKSMMMPEPVMQTADKQPAEQLMEIEAEKQDCPPVTVDLSLVEMPDKSQRLVASSPDGNILGGVDTPVRDAAPIPDPKLWAAGAMISTRQNLGVWIDRDFDFLRVGSQLNTVGNESGVRGVEAWGKVGIKF